MRSPTEESNRRSLPTRWNALASAVRRILGMPDYAAYLEHCRRAGHPALLTEREFTDEFFERKGRTVRCC